MKFPLFGAFNEPKTEKHMLGPIQKIDFPMRRFEPDEEVDICIVGVGSAGGVLVQRLARAGFRVVGIEAGPFWDTERDWVSDEAGSSKLYWNDLRITGGEDPITLGANNSLLNSACPGFENGLANSSGTVGKYLMVQIGNVVLGRFEQLVRMYKAPPAHALTEEFYETNPKNDFIRGFAIQTVGPLPIAFSKQMMVAKGAWGWGMRRVMMDYNHWAALGVLGEILPWEDNRVELADEKDRHGLRVAKVTFGLHDNDKKVAAAGVKKTTEIMQAAGAQEVVQEARYAHLVGGARMGGDPRTSVANSFGQTHDIANLFVCDGSLLPTQGSANPGLTIQALAARTADFIIANRDDLLSDYPSIIFGSSLPVRSDLSPPEAANKGVPRVKEIPEISRKKKERDFT